MENIGIKEGDAVKVKLIEIDKKTGKYRLSMRALMEKPEGYVEREARPRRENGDRGPRREGGENRPRRDGNGAPRHDMNNRGPRRENNEGEFRPRRDGNGGPRRFTPRNQQQGDSEAQK